MTCIFESDKAYGPPLSIQPYKQLCRGSPNELNAQLDLTKDQKMKNHHTCMQVCPDAFDLFMILIAMQSQRAKLEKRWLSQLSDYGVKLEKDKAQNCGQQFITPGRPMGEKRKHGPLYSL